MYNVMVTPYKQIHLQKATMPTQQHPLEINVQHELHEDLSHLFNTHGGLTGAAEELLSDMDNNGEFI